MPPKSILKSKPKPKPKPKPKKQATVEPPDCESDDVYSLNSETLSESDTDSDSSGSSQEWNTYDNGIGTESIEIRRTRR